MEINEQKDRPINPLYTGECALHSDMEDDYSEESGPDDVCMDWGWATNIVLLLNGFILKRRKDA